MTELIACLSTGKGTWGHVNRLLEDEQWTKVYLLTNAFGKENFTTNEKTELITLDLNKGIKELIDDVHTASDGKNNRVFVESYAGGPAEPVPWAVYNAVGTAYPYLTREQKDKALEKLLNIFDGMNYQRVNGYACIGHTTGIREPSLLADITIARALYWPGLHDESTLTDNCTTFGELQESIMDDDGLFKPGIVKSDFAVAYRILRSDMTSFGEEYAQAAQQPFLQRVLNGIVGLRFSWCQEPAETEKRKARLQELLPKSLHDQIESFRQEADWVDHTKFN